MEKICTEAFLGNAADVEIVNRDFGGDAQNDKALCMDGMTECFIEVCLSTPSPAVDEKKSALFIDDRIPDDFKDVSLVIV